PVAQVASIDVVDEHTVRFRFAQPYAPLLQQLNVTEAPLIPAHLYAGNPTLAQLNLNTVGTGPMKFASASAAEARVVRNPGYFRAPLPYLDEIVMRPLVDDAARFQALRSGDVDFLWDVPDASVAGLAGNPAFATEATQSLGGGANSIDQLVFNLTASGDRRGQMGGPDPAGTPDPHPILGGMDPLSSGAKVRRAIAHAIDRDAYLNVGRSGIGTVALAPISSELAFHAPDIGLPGFDRAQANQLLADAGWAAPAGVMSGANPRVALDHPNENHPDPALRIPDGTPLRLRLVPPSAIFNNRVALVDAQLGAVGIDLQVTSGSTGQLVFIERNFDTTILNYAQGYDPHIGVRRQYHSDQVSTTNVTNAAGYKNALVDAAFDEAARTIDFDERFARYRAFQAQVAQDLPYVWIIETPNVRGYTARCQRFKVFTGLFAEGAHCRQPS
ncbi:MAG: ABC transporter substrate-binding protein, partial [Solirubrobacteraceae bacterium]